MILQNFSIKYNKPPNYHIPSKNKNPLSIYLENFKNIVLILDYKHISIYTSIPDMFKIFEIEGLNNFI